MKKIFILFTFILFAFALNAQVGRIYPLTIDTVMGAETIYISTNQISGGYNSLLIQALCTQTGGTSDGKITIQGSADGASFERLIDNDFYFAGIANDTLTITNGAVGHWLVKGNPFNFYRLKIEGTSGDTTKITAKYIYK